MQAKIDQNYRRSLLAVLDDGSFTTQPVLANPITKRLLVSAVVTSNNTGIGNTIPGGTPGSVLFLDVGSTLAEDNPNFFYNPSTVSFGIGTNTPNATLTVDGSVHFDLGGDATGDIFYRDAGGFLAPLGIGTAGQILTVAGGLPSWQTPGTGSAGYTTIQDNGTPLTQRSTMNFVNYFDITDVASVTTININTAQLGADTTLISTLETNLDLANISGQINLATQVTGQLSATNIDITNLESTLDLGNISGQIDLATQVTGLLDGANIDQGTLDLGNIGGSLDLATQVTGTLGLANGGTGASLLDPNYNAAYVWDNTTNTTRLANLSGLSYDSGSNTLTSTGSGNKLVQDMTAYSSSSTSTSWRTMYTESIPGGTLGTNNSIRVTLLNSLVNSNGNSINWSIRISYGGTVLTTLTTNPGSANSFNETFSFISLISANGSTSSQVATSTVTPATQQYTSPLNVQNVVSGTSSINSTSNQNLVIEIINNTAFATVDFSASGILIEKIS